MCRKRKRAVQAEAVTFLLVRYRQARESRGGYAQGSRPSVVVCTRKGKTVQGNARRRTIAGKARQRDCPICCCSELEKARRSALSRARLLLESFCNLRQKDLVA